MSRLTQKKKVLEILKDHHQQCPGEFLPVWWFVGERYVYSLGEVVMLSHRAPARLTELYQEGLVDRKMVKGVTGAYYYSYIYKENGE